MIEITYENKKINTEKIKVSTLLKHQISEKNAIACRFNNEVKSLNGSNIIKAKGDGYIVVTGLIDQTVNITLSTPIFILI